MRGAPTEVWVRCQRVQLWMQSGASSTRSGDSTRKKRAMRIRTRRTTTEDTRRDIPLCNNDTWRSCRWLVVIHCTHTCCWHRWLFTTTNLYKYITTFVSWGFARKRSNTYTNTYTRSYGNCKWLYYLCIICPWKETLRNNEKFNGKKEPLRDELNSMIK